MNCVQSMYSLCGFACYVPIVLYVGKKIAVIEIPSKSIFQVVCHPFCDDCLVNHDTIAQVLSEHLKFLFDQRTCGVLTLIFCEQDELAVYDELRWFLWISQLQKSFWIVLEEVVFDAQAISQNARVKKIFKNKIFNRI